MRRALWALALLELWHWAGSNEPAAVVGPPAGQAAGRGFVPAPLEAAGQQAAAAPDEGAQRAPRPTRRFRVVPTLRGLGRRRSAPSASLVIRALALKCPFRTWERRWRPNSRTAPKAKRGTVRPPPPAELRQKSAGSTLAVRPKSTPNSDKRGQPRPHAGQGPRLLRLWRTSAVSRGRPSCRKSRFDKGALACHKG